MALRPRTIDLPFGGGVDQDTHEHLLGGGPRVATLSNMRFDGGGYIVRPSYDDVSGPSASVEALTEYEGTLLAFTDEGAYRLDDETNGAWRQAASTGPRAVDLRTRSIRRSDYGVDWVGTAANGGYVLEAWSNTSDGAVYYRVVRADTGAPVRSDTELGTIGTTGGINAAKPHVVAIGSNAFVIACREDGATNHHYCVITVSSGVVTQGSVTSLGITTSAFRGMHAQQDGADLYVVTSTELERFTRSGTTLTNESAASLPANFVARRVYDNAVGGYVVVVGYSSSSGDIVSTSATRGATLSGTLTETTILAVGGTDPTTTRSAFTVVTRDASGNLLVAYDGTITHGATDSWAVRWYECDAQGAPDNTAARVIWNHRLHAHAFADESNGTVFLPTVPSRGDNSSDPAWLEWVAAADGSPLSSQGGVVRRAAILYQVDDRSSTTARAICRYQLDVARHRREGDSNPGEVQYCEVYETEVGSGTWVFGTETDEGVTVDREAGVSARLVEMSLGGHVAQAQHNRTALAATGILSAYDGADHAEQTVLPPSVLAAAQHTGGFGGSAAPTGTAGTEWSHALVWRYRDAQGNLRRSAPTYVPIGNGASTNIEALQFRVAEPIGAYASLDDVYLEVYQSPADPRDGGADGTYYRNSIYDAAGIIYSSGVVQLARWVDIRDSGAPHESVSMRTDTTFVDLTDRLQLYTNGGVLENDPEPCPAYLLGSRDRMWLIDSEDRRTAWFSKPLRPDRPVEWSATQTVRVPAESGELTALGIAGDYVVLLAEDAIYYIEDVEGPDSTGAGAFPPVRRASREVGCINAASVVTSDVGLFFESRAGLYLLTAGLQLVDVGAPVEDSVASGTITAATACPATQQVIFLTQEGAALAYDYDRGEWSVYALRPPQGNPTLNAACARRGEHVFCDGGSDVYVANDDDHGSINTTLTTGWLKLAGLQGFQRIWRLGVLGRVVAEASEPGGTLTDYGTLSVSIAYDYDETDTVGPYTIELDDISPRDPMHIRLHMARQPSVAIKVTVGFTAGQNAETIPTATTGIPVRLELSGLALEVGVNRGVRKIGYGGGADVGGA